MKFDRETLGDELLQTYLQEQNNDDEPTVRIKILVPILFIVFVLSAGIVWYISQDARYTSTGQVPLVRADTTPVRIKPKNPGGMYIANRDKMVYDNIAINKLPKVIKILPRSEEPVSRQELVKEQEATEEVLRQMAYSMLDKAAKGEKLTEIIDKLNKKVDVKPEREVLISSVELLSDDVPKEIKLEVKKEIIKPKVETKKIQKKISANDFKQIPRPVRKTKSIKLNSKNYGVQLGSYKSQQDIDLAWGNIKKKNKFILQEMPHSVQKADLGKKGIFYRLRAGSFYDIEQARKICKKLSERKQACFVVEL